MKTRVCLLQPAVVLALALAPGWSVTALDAAPLSDPPREAARQILQEAGVKGGLVVHLGCGDGQLTAALRANDNYLVQGLDTDLNKVKQAQAHIQSLGLYGPVAVDRFEGKSLPFIDNLVNLLVVSGSPGQVSSNEILRVLTPNGVALFLNPSSTIKNQEWTKPRPKEIADWTHYLHNPSGNAVSPDTVVGPPRHFQWLGNPRYSRHHDHMSAASAMVSANGRLFYIFDYASPQAIQLPSDYRLVARDAFNGTVLWQRPIAEWHPRLFRLKSGPAQLPRRLVAMGDRVYVTLGLEAAVSALDAATGETIRTYAGTENTEEILLSNGTLFVMINDSPARQPATPSLLNYNFVEGARRVAAVDAASGKLLWNAPQAGVLPLTLCANEQRVFFCEVERVVCLDRTNGRKIWESELLSRRAVIPTFFAPTLVIYRDMVLYSGGRDKVEQGGGDNTMYALSAETGKILWTADHPPSGYKSPEDILVVGGLAWTPATTMGKDSGVMIGRDPRTGEVRKQFLPDVDTHWFHHRCYRAKATENYILTSRTGIEFVDPKTERWECHHWVRGACLYGTMPANGMIYNPPHPCACYLEAKLYGFHALAPAAPTRTPPKNIPAAERLEKGPAFAEIANRKSQIVNSKDWPTYRNDASRSGFTKTAVPAELQSAWQTKLGGRLSSPVIAEGKVFIASIDQHTVHALAADSGKPAWSFTAGGRVDSPPTIWQGRALFGSADGHVYCLRASDGALGWRFRAAPVDWRMGAFEQLESVWPVHGSVLIRDGELWCVAGRSMFLDGGLRLLRINPANGTLIAESLLDDRDPDSGQNLQVRLKGLNMPVALPDVLSCDDTYVYMRSQRFDGHGSRQEIEVPNLDASAQRGEGPHLFCPTGFLDDVWWHRSYWLFGRVFKSGAGGYYLAGRNAPAGRPMVFNESTIFGYGRKPQYYRWTTPMEYQLFATAKQPELIRTGEAQAEPAPARKKAAAKKQGAAKKQAQGAAPTTRVALDWTKEIPILVRAMVLADKTLFLAGPPDVLDEEQSLKTFDQPETQKSLARQAAVYAGAEGALLWAVSTSDGARLAEYKLKDVPVFDGLAAAQGRLYLTTAAGEVLCFSGTMGR